MIASVIQSEEEITPQWLTKILRRNGHLIQQKVDRVKLEPCGKAGFGSIRFRVEAIFDGEVASTTPTQFYVKFSKPEKSVLSANREVDFYLSERTLDVPILKCFEARYSASSNKFHLVFEDLSTTHHPSESFTHSPEEYESMAKTLACLHSNYWNCLDTGTVQPSTFRTEFMSAFTQYQNLVPQFLKETKAHSDEKVQLFNTVIDQFQFLLW